MKEHPTTESIFFSVMDGHGEVGHWVSRHFERMLPSLVTQHREYSTNPANAMAEMLLQEEQTVMNNRSIDTSLSGSTAVLCTSRSVSLCFTSSCFSCFSCFSWIACSISQSTVDSIVAAVLVVVSRAVSISARSITCPKLCFKGAHVFEF